MSFQPNLTLIPHMDFDISPTRAYFEPTEEDHDQQHDANRKRSSRACDQCRKTKSKCERVHPDDDSVPCKTCLLTNTQCTFLGPSYKRGPPKGYIHAIEQRWHHVEAVLGAILSCQDARAQSLVADIRKDDLAREILNRVDVGPFGPTGRTRMNGRTDDSLSSLLMGGRIDANSTANGREARSRRQSRVSREIVSSTQDLDPLPEPTLDWQDRLASRLGGGSGYTSSSSSANGHPHAQRRRIDGPEWENMYTFDGSDQSEEKADATDGEDNVTAMGHLSLDENQEIRFHGKASGLHLLGNRVDKRKDGGLWTLPMAGVWPPSSIRPARLEQEEQIEIHLPPISDQDRLLQLYFIYVHPNFPIIHKGKFLEEWEAQRRGSPVLESHPRDRSGSPYSSQVSKAVLLAMFALASRYLEQPPDAATRGGAMWEIGCNYAIDCREVLNKIYHHSRLSSSQALLLLGMHEFGIGQSEQAWMFVGMGIRMAEDLGLNRAADRWQHDGRELFTPEEIQIRRTVWGGCLMADVFISIYLGRPVSISDTDYDTQIPIIPEDDEELWQPHALEPFKPNYQPAPGRIISCFRQTMGVVRILSDIVRQIYPVVYRSRTPKRARLMDIEQKLDQWYIELPEELRYETSSKRPVPPPHIMVLHVRYWSAVLLLHRAFVPRLNSAVAPKGINDPDTVILKSFDMCQSAASHVSSIVSQYDEHFGMKRSSLFLASYILSAGIMHVVTLNLRQNNVQASLGLRQCLVALEKMEMIWPAASKAKDLLNGANVQYQGLLTPLANAPDRCKRPAEDISTVDNVSEAPRPEAFVGYDKLSPSFSAGPEDTRIMARMLGLEIPGVQASTSYFPGYEYWPSIAMPPLQAMSMHTNPMHTNQAVRVSLPPMMTPQPVASQQQQQPSPISASSPHDWNNSMAGYGYSVGNGYVYGR